MDLREAIARTWEALEPPDYHRKKYRHVQKIGSGAGAHRDFFFRAPKGGKIIEQGKARHMVTHVFEAVLQLHIPERSSAEFDAIYLEYQNLASAVHTLTPIPAGVHVPIVTDYFPEQPITDDPGDIDLVLVIQARTREANGAI